MASKENHFMFDGKFFDQTDGVSMGSPLGLLSHRQILGTGNLPQDSAPVCINIDGALTKQAFCVTAADWSHDHDLININFIVYLMFNLPQFRNSWTDFYRQHIVEKQRFLAFH